MRVSNIATNYILRLIRKAKCKAIKTVPGSGPECGVTRVCFPACQAKDAVRIVGGVGLAHSSSLGGLDLNSR